MSSSHNPFLSVSTRRNTSTGRSNRSGGRSYAFLFQLLVTCTLCTFLTVEAEATTNTGLAADGFFGGSGQRYVDGSRVAFVVRESDQGGIDLNGDGDTGDRVLHLYDISTS